MTPKQKILAKYPQSYCKRKSMSKEYIAYAEPYRNGIISGVGITPVDAWTDLLNTLEKSKAI